MVTQSPRRERLVTESLGQPVTAHVRRINSPYPILPSLGSRYITTETALQCKDAMWKRDNKHSEDWNNLQQLAFSIILKLPADVAHSFSIVRASV